MTTLLYVLLAYLAVCWLWGVYLAIRLYTGRRLSRLLRGQGIRQRKVRPLLYEIETPSQPAAPHVTEVAAETRAA